MANVSTPFNGGSHQGALRPVSPSQGHLWLVLIYPVVAVVSPPNFFEFSGKALLESSRPWQGTRLIDWEACGISTPHCEDSLPGLHRPLLQNLPSDSFLPHIHSVTSVP